MNILPGDMESQVYKRSLTNEQVLVLEEIFLRQDNRDDIDIFIDETWNLQELAIHDESLTEYKKVWSFQSRTAKY